jgi:hypothetical protein
VAVVIASIRWSLHSHVAPSASRPEASIRTRE